MTHVPNTGIEELYRSVIQDVIDQSKEAFLDENIDTDILFQIQKAWEDKVNASGAADLNQKAQPVPTVRPAQPKPTPSNKQSSSSRAPTMVQQESSIPSTSDPQPQPQQLQQQQQYNTTTAESVFRNVAGGAVQIQGLPYNMQQFMVSGNPGNVMLLPVQLSGNQNGPSVIQMTQEQFNQLPQNDGESFIDFENAEMSLDLKAGTLIIDTSKGNSKEIKCEKKKAEEATEELKNLKLNSKNSKKKKKTVNLAIVIPQVDGGPHMSDSSSDDEEDDDDPLSRMVNRIDDKGEEEGEDDEGDEDPLNSDDDQSDDEDLDTLFEATNIIVCQFEKVNRARNKWKFTLKDGIMHLEGKDFCFQKCTGEAEW